MSIASFMLYVSHSEAMASGPRSSGLWLFSFVRLAIDKTAVEIPARKLGFFRYVDPIGDL